MRVRVNSIYRFNPGFMDRNSGIEPNTLVRVVNLYGCPPANTMGQCYIVPFTNAKGDNKGFKMVCTGSLENPEQYVQDVMSPLVEYKDYKVSR